MPKQRRYYKHYLKDFSGGENTHDSPTNLMDHELSSAQNVVPTLRGAVQRRYGLSEYTTKYVGNLARFYRVDGTAELIGGSGTAFYSMVSGGVDDVLDASAYSDAGGADGRVQTYAQYLDRLYFAAYDPADGDRGPVGVISAYPGPSTDDLHVYAAGVHAPTKSGTLAESAGGGLDATSTYKYKIAYGYGDGAGFGESNLGPEISHLLTGANQTITITFFNDPIGSDYQYIGWGEAREANVDKVYIYRTEGDGDDFYLLTTIEGGDLTYEDSTSDADLTAAITLPQSDNYPPDKAKHCCMFNSQLFILNLDGTDGVKPSRVRWSLPLYPDIWPFDNYADAPAGYGAGQGLAVVNGALYIFYESAIVRLTILSGSQYAYETVTTAVGLKHPHTLAVGMEGNVEVAYFWAQDNMVYAFDGTQCKPIGEDVRGYLDSDVLDVSSLHRAQAHAGWDGEAYHLVWTVDAAAEYIQMLRYYPRSAKVEPRTGLSIGTWWPQRYSVLVDKYPAGFCRFDGGSDNNEFVWAEFSKVYTLDSGNDDDGTDITAYFQTGWLDCGTSDVKLFKSLLVVGEFDTAPTVTWETDGRQGTWGSKTDSFTMTTGANPIATFENLEDAIGRHIRIRIDTSDGDAPWSHYSIEIGFEPLDSGTGSHG